MATSDPLLSDALLSLRRAISSSSATVPTTSGELSTDASTDDLAKATHLYFSQPIPHILPITTPTRFISSETPVDLRSIYFAWQKKDDPVPDYIASAQQLNEALGGEQKVKNLVFIEKADLITWLEGASEESEYIKPLEGVDGEGKTAEGEAQVATGAAGVPTVPSGGAAGAQVATGRPVKAIDPRLQEIYNGERKMGDRNSVLRGIKPTVRLSRHLQLTLTIC